MAMALHLGQQAAEFRRVTVQSGGVELDTGGGGVQQMVGRAGLAAVEGLLEPVERLAQVAPRVLLRPVGPEQVRQHLSAVWLVRFQRQECQQRPDIVGREAGQGLASYRGAEWTKQAKSQLRHARIIARPLP